MLKSLTDLQRKKDSGHGTVNPEGIKRNTRSRKRTSSGSSDSDESSGVLSSSSRKRKRKRRHRNSSRDEFKKAKPPTFNGEIKTGQEVEYWILGMKKYFQVQDNSGNMKERVSIFNMNGRASIWWDHLRWVKRISEIRLKWKQFKKYFKQKYLYSRYYGEKIKEFHELRLGQLTMEEYANKFLELLRYVRCMKDEKVKIQCFLSGLPQSYKNRIEFYEPRTLEEAIRKAKYCYE